MPTAEQLLALLDLKPLPLEGGYYRETYRDTDLIPAGWLPRYATEKAVATAIYYLLTPDTFSALHRLPTEEIYHFYLGDPVRLLQLFPNGAGREVIIGSDLLGGQQPQVVVGRGIWQGSRLREGGKFALLGATVAPGFDFADFEAGDRHDLQARYPVHKDLIQRLTR